MSNLYNYCNVAGDTNVGCKRKANEDWYGSFECQNGLVAVVCDGMGGHVGGKEASHLAVDTIQHFLENNYFDNPREAIIAACNAANQAILRHTALHPELQGMGSTCVMLIVRDGKVYMGSVGDSRIYLVHDKRIVQLTEDQSYVQMLVNAGEITKEEAERHPRRNEITNALGLPTMQPATVREEAISPKAGNCFLLCSDGLSGMVSDKEIEKIVSNQAGMSQQDRVDALINKARAHGGLDNITCVIVEFAIDPCAADSGSIGKITSKFSSKTNLYALIAAAILVIAGVTFWLWPKEESDANGGVDTSFIAGLPEIKMNESNTPDTIVWKANEEFIQIEQYDSKISIKLCATGKTFSLEQNVDTLAWSDEALVVKTQQGSRLNLQFTNQEYNKENFILYFKAKEIVYTYSFKIVKVKQTEEKTASVVAATSVVEQPVKINGASNKEQPANNKQQEGDASVAFANAGVDELGENAKNATSEDASKDDNDEVREPEAKFEPVFDVTFSKLKKDEVITLHGEEGINNDRNAYFGDVAFSGTPKLNGVEGKEDEYVKYNTDGNKVTIQIKGALPKNYKIIVPIKPTGKITLILKSK